MPHIRSIETVTSALAASDRGLPDAENAALHGVAVKTIRRWRRLYQRRGLPRGQTHTDAPCPRCDGAVMVAPAYAELLGWYLGDGHVAVARRGVYNLRIYNDARYVELNAHIADLMRAVKPGGRPHAHERAGCTRIAIGWKHWPCLFPQHGSGRKHDRLIELAPWQKEIVSTQPAEFLRGLFHSDGARSANWTQKRVAGKLKRYDYPRWQFSNNSGDIRALCCWALDLLEIPWKQSNWKTISVSRREAVSRLDDLIGLKA